MSQAIALPKLETAEMYAAGELCESAADADLEGLQKLLASGHNVNSRDYDHRTALHIAAANGNADAVQLLLDNGAKSSYDRFGLLPVDEAKRTKRYHIEKMLREGDSDVTPKWIAAQGSADIDDDLRHQMHLVFQLILKEGVFSYSLVASEVYKYYTSLGLDSYYFELFTAPQIAKHVQSLISSKHAALGDSHAEHLHINIHDHNSLFTCFTHESRPHAEAEVEKFVKESPHGFHVTYFKSRNPLVEGGEQNLSIFYVERDDFENLEDTSSDDLYVTATPTFLRTKKQRTLHRYEAMVAETMDKPYPIIRSHKPTHTFKHDIKIGHRAGRTNDYIFLRQLSRTFEYLGIDFHKLHIDSFSNGVHIYSIYCDAEEDDVKEIENFASLALTIPDVPMYKSFMEGDITARQLMYLYSATRFAYYFQREANDDYDFLHEYLSNDPDKQKKLMSLGQSIGTEVYSMERLYSFVQNNLEVGQELFIDFSRRMTGDLEGYEYPDIDALLSKVRDPDEQRTMRAFHYFNKSVTTTNLWKHRKSAVSYRLDPQQFLTKHKLPELPFAIYMMLGMDFTGFHVRFRDISRGGVRLIKSTSDSYRQNRVTQFQENFNLAYTQKLKNKDIPESGSKGTILMKRGKNHMAEHAFKQYVDSLIDLIINDEGVRNNYDKEEYIFLGPDENTAGFMDLACEYSRERNYGFWQSFTTGKSNKLGGVPHDTYGMTTRSVRAFVTGLMERHNLKQEECTKVMTGGPDGDLGSNEILMSKEKIVGICDGSGSLYDPNGLDREALEKLARNRQMVHKWDGQLSKEGFLLTIDQQDVTLPDGTFVRSGEDFRNTFHLWDGLEADFFVPCGGRPGSVTAGNVHRLFKSDGTPRYKYVVEGANLFVTDPARTTLQDRGVALFKDASTNKGGVTSSSLEVLAGLSLSSAEFAEHMQVGADGAAPAFYQQYVQDICETVETNARNEFNYIFDTVQETSKFSTDVTNELSGSMNDLNDIIGDSDLFEDEQLRTNVLRESLPASLQELVGLDKIMERVPIAYQRAIFSMHLSSKFFYENGASADPLKFYSFMKHYDHK